MPIDESKFKDQLKSKDKEVQELKELLAEAESEIKELNDFHGLQKPKASILENAFLNKAIKYLFFAVLCVFIVVVGIYPWLNKDKFVGENAEEATIDLTKNLNNEDEADKIAEEEKDNSQLVGEVKSPDPAQEPAVVEKKNMLVVASDLGWLNVRTEPDVKTGDIIKKINSGDEYEWLEKTNNNWYKIKIDSKGNTGYISGEYAELK